MFPPPSNFLVITESLRSGLILLQTGSIQVNSQINGEYCKDELNAVEVNKELEYHSFEVTRAKSGTKGMASPQYIEIRRL
jgi:hypothetical protein